MSAFTRFDALLDVLAQLCRRLTRWLTKPRASKRGTLAPVLVTADGVVVDRVSRVPIRSSKADGKRVALAFARERTGNPALTWGQARKLMKRWMREERVAGGMTPEMAVAVEESE